MAPSTEAQPRSVRVQPLPKTRLSPSLPAPELPSAPTGGSDDRPVARPTARIWVDNCALAAAWAVALAIVGFYTARLSMPAPLFGIDEGSYLLRALYDEATIARNPFVANVTNGALAIIIRVSASLGGSYIVADRWVNAGIYIGGLGVFSAVATHGLRRRTRLCLSALALGFPFYRFAFSDMAEGPFVGLLAIICAVTWSLYRRRPLLHAVTFGALAAALVLIKPHGICVLLAFGLAVVVDAVLSRRFRHATLRLAGAGFAFLVAGNLIQYAAGEPVKNLALFFVSPFYDGTLHAALAPQAVSLALLNMAATSSAFAILAGVPIVVGLADLADRWWVADRRAGFKVSNREFGFLMLLMTAVATLAMVTLFALKMATSPGETHRLWGRYIEFLAPLLWLSAGPSFEHADARRSFTRALCVAVMGAGLIGLLASFRAGVVLYPWDATAITAFFAPKVGATIETAFPFRPLAISATLAAMGWMAAGRDPLRAGLALTLTLAVLSTKLDSMWLGVMIQGRMRSIRTSRPWRPGSQMACLARSLWRTIQTRRR